MNLKDTDQEPEIRIVNRFYPVFAVFVLTLLLIGVPLCLCQKTRRWGLPVGLAG